MKQMKKVLAFLLAFTLTFGCMSGIVNAETGIKPADGVTEDQPFAPGTGGSQNFRIPCLVSLDNGTIVAACDARWNHGSDACGLDTIVSYSKDNGATWNYTFANYLGDNGNKFDYNSTAFIDPAIATDGQNVYMIADLYPAGIAINTTPNTHRPLVGSTGFDENDNLILAAATETVNGLSPSANRIAQEFNYHLEKNPDADAESYYLLKEEDGSTVEGYVIDAYFNIKGKDVDTNLFCGDSPYFPWPTDYLYMTKSSDGGKTWSAPTLLNLKKETEQTLLVGPGRGIYTSTERIVFTCYEFTSGDRNSACIYSDDGGVTWERGDSVSDWSSEAVVTEADGKLYMFTRHGGYYVSEDFGETWSPKKTMGITYNLGCQLTAITYSEKIDGKTAILFAAPSNTGSRAAGKIFVGLVQDDGSLRWAYEYSINGNATYAYSCLAELIDGSLGLLYESAGTAISYKNIAITDVVKGAAIGNIWCADGEGNITSSVVLKPGESVTLDVEGSIVGTLQAESSKIDVAGVSLNGNAVTIAADSAVAGLGQSVVTITDGTNTAKVIVYVTSEETYEIVKLRMGDTKTYTVDGDFSNADLSGIDTDIATVTVTCESAEENTSTELQAQLATAAGTFNGDTVNVSDCEYTFTSTGTQNQYTISSVADGTTVYLHQSSGNNVPNKTDSAAITVAKHSTDAKFTFYDNGKTASNGGYLYFWRTNTAKLYFDRNSTVVDDCYLEIFEKSDSAPTNSPIEGYAKVDAIRDGGKYLIAAKANDNNYYILHPTTTTTNFTHVAKVTELKAGQKELGVQLASATGRFDVEELVKARDCEFTFTSTGTDNQYTISGTTADGSTVSLNIQSSAQAPTKDTASNINILEGSQAGTFRFKDVSFSSGTHLHFYYDNTAKLHFDRCGSSCGDGDLFEIYVKSESAPENSVIPGYAKVASLDAIEDGGKYLIARQATDNNYYVLRPARNASNYEYVAKVAGYIEPKTTSEIIFTGVAEGSTSVKIGDVTYYVDVENEVKNISLEVGDTYVVKGELMKSDSTQTLVEISENTVLPPYEASSKVTSGKYLIGNTSHIMTNTAVTGSPNGLGMKAVNFAKAVLSEDMWTVQEVTGGYTIQDGNGKYININGQSVTLSDTAQTLVIGVRNSNVQNYQVSGNGYYLNNWAGSNTKVAAYSSSDNDWNFYQPVKGIVIEAKAEGTTSIIAGGTTYNITVTAVQECQHTNTEVQNAKEATCTEAGYTGDTVCKDCHVTVSQGETIPATGEHTYGDWVVVKEAATKEEGSKEKTCSVCGDKVTEVLPKLPATIEDKEETQKYYEGCLSYYSEEKYGSAAGWAKYVTAMEALKAVLADDTATVDEVANAVAAVEAATEAIKAEVEKVPVKPGTPEETDKDNKDDENSKDKDNKDNVQTGDATSMIVWVMLIVAACVILVIRKRRVR